MNRSTPGLPVHHQLPEFTETHAHQVSDAIQPSHPLSSPSPPAPNPSQHQSLFQWVNSSHEVARSDLSTLIVAFIAFKIQRQLLCSVRCSNCFLFRGIFHCIPSHWVSKNITKVAGLQIFICLYFLLAFMYPKYLIGGVSCAVLSLFSHVWLFATPWTVARQAPLSMRFSRRECWSGLPFSSTEPASPAWEANSLSLSQQGSY